TVRPSLRRAAFLFWATVEEAGDLPLLQRFEGDAELGDRVLRARAYRADRTATPLIVARLREPEAGWTWWHAATGMWDGDFVAPLVEAIDRSRNDAADQARDIDWKLSEALEHLSPAQAETILAPRWEALGHQPRFFQKALFFATPKL